MSNADDGGRSPDPDGPVGWLRWFLTTEEGPAVYVRDVLVSVGAVLLIGLALFAISGVWPPMVAVESPSMEPNMERGDLVFIVGNERFTPEEAPVHGGESTGVVPADVARESGRTKFGGHGDVIVFTPNGDPGRTPIIHRAMLWVEADEDWYERADSDYLRGAESCEELRDCPAPYSGFVTLGDNNPAYDQAGNSQISALVRPGWVVGTAELKVPYLGHVRLWFAELTLTVEPSGAVSETNAVRNAPALSETDATRNATAVSETSATRAPIALA